MKTIYECSQSKKIKWFTAIFFFVVILAILVEMYFVSKGINVTAAIIVTAILLVASFSCFFVFPMYIIADEEGIGIRTLFHTKRILYEDIDYIERVDEQRRLFINNGKICKITLGTSYQWGPLSSGNTIRQFGIGGIFGYIGWFHTKGIGTFLAYVTDEKKAFLIHRTNGIPVAISVSEPDEFMPYYMKGGKK
jgi:uncharacterized membrane protein YobD (UPF0266 family)